MLNGKTDIEDSVVIMEVSQIISFWSIDIVEAYTVVQYHQLETGAKKIGLVFWAISDIKNGFAAFC